MCWICSMQQVTLIAGIGDAIWSKTNFGPTSHHHPWSMHRSQRFCLPPPPPPPNEFWKSHSVRVVSTSYGFASITSVVPKWRPFRFILNRGNAVKLQEAQSDGRGRDSHVVFGQKFSGEKEMWDGALSWCTLCMYVYRPFKKSLRWRGQLLTAQFCLEFTALKMQLYVLLNARSKRLPLQYRRQPYIKKLCLSS
jgi:hypothetical protein